MSILFILLALVQLCMIVQGEEPTQNITLVPTTNTTNATTPNTTDLPEPAWHFRKFRTWIETSELLPLLVNLTGGRIPFLRSLRLITDDAESIHNSTEVHFFDLVDKGSGGLIGRIDFYDNTTWAVKIGAQNVSERVRYGVNTMKMLEKYCPHIPVPRVHGEMNVFLNMSYYFMDWMPGKIMAWDCKYLRIGEDVDIVGERNEMWNVTIPAGIMRQLAEATYNLTNCPIPKEEVMQLVWDPLIAKGRVELDKNGEITAVDWGRDMFVEHWKLLEADPWPKDVSTYDKFRLLSWAVKKLEAMNDYPFVLYHWDLRPQNVLMDDNQQISGIIDWDHVHPVPLPLTAITQEDGLLHSSKGQELYLLESQNATFLTYLANLESSHPSSLNTSYLYNNSRQHDFLNRLLRRSHQETFIKYYSDLVSAAYSETTTEDIQKEWDYFCNRYFVKQALRIPDWPQYIDVQEQLGLHKRKLLHTLRWNKLPTGWRGWSRISLPEGTWDWI